MSQRPHYDKAYQALRLAHEACFTHPKRGLLGMSSGPFSGVNVALGIVDALERENRYMRQRLMKVEAELRARTTSASTKGADHISETLLNLEREP